MLVSIVPADQYFGNTVVLVQHSSNFLGLRPWKSCLTAVASLQPAWVLSTVEYVSSVPVSAVFRRGYNHYALVCGGIFVSEWEENSASQHKLLWIWE